jgi:hypothetical protein
MKKTNVLNFKMWIKLVTKHWTCLILTTKFCWEELYFVMIYLTRKLDQKSTHFDICSIWPLNHIGQVDLNTSNLTNVFFIDHKVVFLLVKSNQKIGQPKNLN